MLRYRTMIDFVWEWAFFLLPLPFFAKFFLPASQPACGAAINVPFYEVFTKLKGARSATWFGTIQWHIVVAWFIWFLLVLSLSRPQWVSEPNLFPTSGRDLLLAVDISGSMSTQDFLVENMAVTRLDAVKEVAGDFIERRKGDRIGLILFGSKAYLQAPLTFDVNTIKHLLQESEIGWAGKDTAIGDAIGLALKTLWERPNESKILILLTDGTNTAGIADPLQAGEFAAKHGLKIYTIGVGIERVKIGLSLSDVDSAKGYLDEHTLEVVARMTGGQYFRAEDTTDLERIYASLQKIEPAIGQNTYRRILESLFYWPLGFALILSLILTRLLMSNFSIKEWRDNDG
jgi:Ca-activated chloride channel homolog